MTAQAKEAQATVQSKFAEVVGGLDTDLKKLGETAQDLALRGVGVAAEYAVKAREKYEEVAHGAAAAETFLWRGTDTGIGPGFLPSPRVRRAPGGVPPVPDHSGRGVRSGMVISL
ncbi:hypothetical protein STANM309S_03806 [Streptomyces tanashiensis]